MLVIIDYKNKRIIMNNMNAKQLLDTIKKRNQRYNDDEHCLMILEILPTQWRVSAFCAEALITETTFWNWVNKHPLFKICYGIGQILAQEAWEKEEIDNIDNPDWDRRKWLQKGSRYFAKDKAKLQLEIDSNATPWEQYQQILKQAEKGDFTASEIKQLMESVNVGTRVYEAFKLQQEVDNMKAELNEMSQRHGNNTLSINTIKEVNKTTL